MLAEVIGHLWPDYMGFFLTDVTGSSQQTCCVSRLFLHGINSLQPLEKVLPHCQIQQSHFLSFPAGMKMTRANFRQGARIITKKGSEECHCKWKSIKPATGVKSNLCENVLWLFSMMCSFSSDLSSGL